MLVRDCLDWRLDRTGGTEVEAEARPLWVISESQGLPRRLAHSRGRTLTVGADGAAGIVERRRRAFPGLHEAHGRDRVVGERPLIAAAARPIIAQLEQCLHAW